MDPSIEIAKLIQDHDANCRVAINAASQVIHSQKISILSQLFGDLTSKVLWKILGLCCRWGIDTTEMSTMLCLLTDYVSLECAHLGLIEETNSFLQRLAHAWNKCLIQVKKDCSNEVFKAVYQNLMQYSERFGKHGLSCIFINTLAFAEQLMKAKQWNSVNPADYVTCTFPNLPSISCVSGQTLNKIIQAGNSLSLETKENISPNLWGNKVQASHVDDISDKLSTQNQLGNATSSVTVTEPLASHKGFKAKTMTSNPALNSHSQNILTYFGKANGKKKLKSMKNVSRSNISSTCRASNQVDTTSKKNDEDSLQAWSLDTLLKDKKCTNNETLKDGPQLKAQKKTLKIRKTINDKMLKRKETRNEPVSEVKRGTTNKRDLEVDHDSLFFTPDQRKTCMLEKNVSCESEVKSCSLPLLDTTMTADSPFCKTNTSNRKLLFSSTKYEPTYTRCDSDSLSSLSSSLSSLSSSSFLGSSFKSEDSLPSLLSEESDQSSFFKDEDDTGILDHFMESEDDDVDKSFPDYNFDYDNCSESEDEIYM